MSLNPRGQSVFVDSNIAQRAINRADTLKARQEDKEWRETIRQDNKKYRDAAAEWQKYQQTQIMNTDAAQASLTYITT